MADTEALKNMDKPAQERAQALFLEHRQRIFQQTDRIFVGLMTFQWIAGIVIALVVSPKTWLGAMSQTHAHVWTAVFLGGAIAVFPITLGILMPGRAVTRNVIAVAQMLMSALLIHLTGGRIETHFHVFGSLAFLAFYRDWRILVPATIVVALDHMIRGTFWPQSVFGVLTASPWRWVEHAGWVVFEDIFLISSCQRSVAEMWSIAERTAELEAHNRLVEVKVKERTRQLLESKETLASEITERKKLEMMIVQSEKMAAIGQLAAGVAHEINNPVGFINSNLQTLEQYIGSYAQLLRLVESLKGAILEKDMAKADAIAAEMNKLEQEINLDFVMSDMDNLLRESQVGIERIRKIVLDLRTFARSDTDTMESAKVEEIIDSILSIIYNELKYKAELKKNYTETPFIRCNPQKLGQVFINLLVNAAQAIKERGVIEIKTYQENGHVCVDVRDTGQGIEAENLGKIFDVFFTTKPVGQGTGLGLSVSYDIVKKHGGDIRVRSQVGKGTTFTVMLPLSPQV